MSLPDGEAQAVFTRYIRDPEAHPPPPWMEKRRSEVYRRLFYNNIKGFIDRAYGVLRHSYAEKDWEALVRDFMRRHQCHSPYFRDISREFLLYLEYAHKASPQDPPFLLDLAHYEWLFIALEHSDAEISEQGVDPDGDLLAGRPVLSPLVCSLRYNFPVHKISRQFQPGQAEAGGVWLVAYRDRADKVRFMESNPGTARLLMLAAPGGRTGREMLDSIAAEYPKVSADVVLARGRETLNTLKELDILLGTAAS